MENFTPVTALIGGVLIGAASVLLMLANGRIAGISGIAGGLFTLKQGDIAWRIAFIAGLIAAPFVDQAITGTLPEVSFPAPWPLLVIGGLLVGFGTQLGSGCTSGHGVCGIARFSKRSLVATVTFMATAVLTVFLVRHLFGG